MLLKNINKLVWWIPIKKLRDDIRNKLIIKQANKKMDLKYGEKETIVIDPNNDNDIEKIELVKDIIYKKRHNKTTKILHDYFINNKDNAIRKPFSYFDLYERYFKKYRGRDINLLEIGVQNGGSTKMWKHYFTHMLPGIKVQIYGIDIDEKCKSIEEEGIKIFIGSQSDRNFWKKIKNEIPKLDIVIDDGGHSMEQQIVTLEEIYDHIKDDGLYWCEDVGTSYWPETYGGGYKKKTSYIEYTKNIIDYLNANSAIKKDSLEINKYTNTAYSICFHENVVVIEKKIRPKIYQKYLEALIGINLNYGKRIY